MLGEQWVGEISPRLVSLVSLEQMRTLTVHRLEYAHLHSSMPLGHSDLNAAINALAKGLLFPYRLRRHDQLPLDRLRLIATSNGRDTSALQYHLLINFDPVRVEFWSHGTLFASRAGRPPIVPGQAEWGDMLRAWRSLRSMYAIGWHPMYDRLGTTNLAASPWVANGGEFTVEMYIRWDEAVSDDPVWLLALTPAGGIRSKGLRVRLVVGQDGMKRAEQAIAKLTDEQRARVQLVLKGSK